MTADLNDPLDDVLQAPLVVGPRAPVTIAVGVKLAKQAAIEKKLAKAQADHDRWLDKMLRAARRVDRAGIQIRRYRYQLTEQRK